MNVYSPASLHFWQRISVLSLQQVAAAPVAAAPPQPISDDEVDSMYAFQALQAIASYICVWRYVINAATIIPFRP